MSWRGADAGDRDGEAGGRDRGFGRPRSAALTSAGAGAAVLAALAARDSQIIAAKKRITAAGDKDESAEHQPLHGAGTVRRIVPRFSAPGSAWKAFTAAAGPSGWPQTALQTARKSAPASTSARPFSGVMPPIATQGISNRVDHQDRIDGSGRWRASLVAVGKKAPNAT